MHRSKMGNQPFHLSFQKADGFSSNSEIYGIPDFLKPKHERKVLLKICLDLFRDKIKAPPPLSDIRIHPKKAITQQ
jgi:hypothetical protein